MTGPFLSSKLWVTQAREDLSDFKIRERSHFAKEDAYTMFEDLKRRPGAKVVGLKLVEPPATLSTKAAQIVGSLRSALDQAAWRASVMLGANEGEKIYFPLAGTKRNFEDMFREKGSCKNIPIELHPFLQRSQGFPTSPSHEGGNNLLYALSPISNPNKHTETYRVGVEAASGTAFLNSATFEELLELKLPPDFDPVNREVILAVTSLTGGYHMNMAIPAYIAFGEVPIVARQPVIPVLNKMADMVESIVLGIEAETARILRKRTS
jgi:hypothetical protein